MVPSSLTRPMTREGSGRQPVALPPRPEGRRVSARTAVLRSEGSGAEGLISQLCSRKPPEQISSAKGLLFPEPCPNQHPECRRGKIVPHGVDSSQLEQNRADNLQIERMKLAIGNGKLSWFKDSSPAEEDLLFSCATCGWTTEMGRLQEGSCPVFLKDKGRKPSSPLILT